MSLFRGARTPEQEEILRMLQNRRYLDEHVDELIRAYPGLWVAVVDGGRVATGKSADEVMAAVGRKADAVLAWLPDGPVPKPM